MSTKEGDIFSKRYYVVKTKIEIAALMLLLSIYVFNNEFKRIMIVKKYNYTWFCRIIAQIITRARSLPSSLHETVDAGLGLQKCYWNTKSNKCNVK